MKDALGFLVTIFILLSAMGFCASSAVTEDPSAVLKEKARVKQEMDKLMRDMDYPNKPEQPQGPPEPVKPNGNEEEIAR